MSREPAKSYAERLPPVVPREEKDISHLGDDMAELLYPGRRPRSFRVSVAFDPWQGEGWDRAMMLARAADEYREPATPEAPHVAAFGVGKAAALRELFEIVGARPGTDVRVDGKRVPYARELWLPLVWLFVTGE
jgi:hypothetical protein